eukprot:m.5131 g.5131  ORF g.5131 m.5131 type:complete len:789 (+) comp12169_c0_seq2:90-2456(+)
MSDSEAGFDDAKAASTAEKTAETSPSVQDVAALRKELEESLKARVALLSKTEGLENETKLLREAEECRRADVQRATDDLKQRLAKSETERDKLSQEKNRVVEETKVELVRMREDRDRVIVEMDQMKRKGQEKIESLESKVAQLEQKCGSSSQEMAQVEKKLKAHDEKAMATIRALETESEAKIKQLIELYEYTAMEKETLSRQLIQGDIERKDAVSAKERAEKKSKELSKEMDRLQGRVKNLQVDVAKWQTACEEKERDILDIKKDLEKSREEISSQQIKVQWAQNKLKTETEGHKETKAKLQSVSAKLKSTKEEAEQIRSDCQAMIRQYQESEEMKSASLDTELKKKLRELKQQEQELVDQQEVFRIKTKELDTLKRNHKAALSELEELRVKVKDLQRKRDNQQKVILEQQGDADRLGREYGDLKRQHNELLALKDQLEKTEADGRKLSADLSSMTSASKDLEQELMESRVREAELLEYTGKLSTRNGELQSELSALTLKAQSLEQLVEKLEEQTSVQNSDIAKLVEALNDTKMESKKMEEEMMSKLADKTLTVEQLTLMVEEERNEIKILKKKNSFGVKDLTRQLQHAKKKLEQYEMEQSRVNENQSGSGSSQGSLEAVNGVQNSDETELGPSVSVVQPGMLKDMDQEKTILVDRICSLQQIHARKDDKMDFYEGHIQHLTEELKKKTRIIQSYILREESGTLSPPLMDEIKFKRAQGKGIMASVFSSRQSDSGVTLDLALEISSRMQAVLEDTVLKNMTLKENLETLGGEIAKLQTEVRVLKMDK